MQDFEVCMPPGRSRRVGVNGFRRKMVQLRLRADEHAAPPFPEGDGHCMGHACVLVSHLAAAALHAALRFGRSGG